MPALPAPRRWERNARMIDLDEMKRDMDAGTAGPWRIPGQPDKVCCDGYTRHGWAKVVTTASIPAWMQGDEPFANARRIARVPDMEATILDQAATIEALRARLAKADELADAVDEWETAEPDSDIDNGFNMFCALAAYRATATDTGAE